MDQRDVDREKAQEAARELAANAEELRERTSSAPAAPTSLHDAHGVEGVQSLLGASAQAAEASYSSDVWSSLRSVLEARRGGGLGSGLAAEATAASGVDAVARDTREWARKTQNLKQQVLAAVVSQLTGLKR